MPVSVFEIFDFPWFVKSKIINSPKNAYLKVNVSGFFDVDEYYVRSQFDEKYCNDDEQGIINIKKGEEIFINDINYKYRFPDLVFTKRKQYAVYLGGIGGKYLKIITDRSDLKNMEMDLLNELNKGTSKNTFSQGPDLKESTTCDEYFALKSNY